MRTVNSDFLRSYDKLKQDVFHSRKEEHMQNLRNKSKPLQPIKLKKIFPWKTLTKFTFLTGAVYAIYNYTDFFIHQITNRHYLSVIDLISLKVLKQDLMVKIKLLAKNPYQLQNLSHFANYMYKNELQTSLNYLKSTYPTHKLKSSVNSGLKIWIFHFNNYEKSQFINQFGDVIQRDENSFLRLWRYPVFKDRRDKVIQQQKVHLQYRSIMESSDDNVNKKQAIGKQIISKCQQINILNRLNSNYEELLTECKQNKFYGQIFTKVIQNRKKLYPYASVKAKSKPQNVSNSN